MINIASMVVRRAGARRLAPLSGALSAATLGLAGAAMAAETKYRAPFALSSGNAATASDACRDEADTTWGDCGGNWAVDEQSGRITASSWIRRTAANTGGDLGAGSHGRVGIDHALAKPAAGVTVTATVELRSSRRAWLQDDVVNQRSGSSGGHFYFSRADVDLQLNVYHSCSRCNHGGTPFVWMRDVTEPNTELVGTPGVYRLKYTLRALEGETINAGDLRVWVIARAANFSFAEHFLQEHTHKDTGKFRSDVDVVVRNINVSAE